MLDKQQKEFLKDLILNIYTYELVFQDLKQYEININYNDTKFIIPHQNALESYYNTLKSISSEIIYNRLINLIQKEALRTLKYNVNNIDKVINYSYKIIN